MLEVAEGIQYIHSEGIVHGNLRGVSIVNHIYSTDSYPHILQENIFLDSEFHCQISDIGLTWHSDATTLSVLNFAAPELFAICEKCYRPDCDGCNGNPEVKKRRTMQIDVYAFGCLHYAVCPSTFSVLSSVTCPDIFRLYPFSRKSTITNSSVGGMRGSSSSVDAPSNG